MLRDSVAILVLSTLAAFGQSGSATINGTVTDSQGAIIPRAPVTAIHVDTNTHYDTTTTEAGVYTLPALPVGRYQVTVAATGFQSKTQSGILLRVADNVRVDFQLNVGVVTEVIDVVAQGTLVDVSNATINKVVENRRLVDLPLDGRSALSMVVLTPNVRTTNVSVGFADRGTTVSTFSINGGPQLYNNMVIDGSSNLNPRSDDSNVNPGVDAIEEFKVQSGVVSAEYGFTLGGIVSLVSKSGTNKYHGSLYEFERNTKLNARNTFATTAPPLNYNQFGASVGGPVRHDRTFFFANFEKWILRKYYTVTATTPTAAERGGDFSQFRNSTGALVPIYSPDTTVVNPAGGGYLRDPVPGNKIPPSRLDPVSLNILKVYPLPNRTPTNLYTNANNFTGNFNARSSAWQGTGKFDHQLSSANRLGVRYTYWEHLDDQASQSTPIFDYNYRTRNDDYKNYNAVIEDTHVFTPRVLNTFRVALARQHFLFAPGTTGTHPVTQFGLPDNVPDIVAPVVAITDSPAIPTFPRAAYSSPGLITQYTLQLQDSVNWVRGRHSVKIGADLRRNLYCLYLTTVVSGQYNFTPQLTANPQSVAGTGSGLASFVFGAVASATIDADAAVSYPNLTQAYFIQDDIKLRKNLTLNLGLRYDYQPIPGERHNGISVFNGTAINPDNGLPGRLDFAGINFKGAPSDGDPKNFGPRVGFAWDIFGTSSLVLRGGYAIYYPFLFPTTAGANGYPALGFTNNFTTYSSPGGRADLPAFAFHNGLPYPPVQPLGSAIGPSAFQGQGMSSIERHTPTPYSQQFTMGLQRQLQGGYVVEGSWSANKGTHLVGGAYDDNQLDPQYLSLGMSLLDNVANPFAGRVSGVYGGATIARSQLLKPWPYYASVSIINPYDTSSIYHSFLASVEKRFSKGLLFLASYTLSKSISDGGGYQSGKYNRRVERSVDGNDTPSRFVLSGAYELPFGSGKRWRSSSGAVNHLIGGWELVGAHTLQSGTPVQVTGANNYTASRPNSTGQSAALPSDQRSLSHWFRTDVFVNPPNFTYGNVGRYLPDVRGPGLNNLDFSLLKSTSIRERLRVQFRAESFNTVNHANYGSPGGTFTPSSLGVNANPNLGVITSARDARIVQLGLKLLF